MNCHEYRVVEVAEDALPAGHDWILIDEPRRVTFVVKRGRLTTTLVAEGWAAYRRVMRKRVAPTYRWAG